MKIIVILRAAADSASPVRIEQGQVVADSLQWVLNPFDEAALAKAVMLRTGVTTLAVAAILVAPASHEALLQRTFALGVQRVIHLCTAPPALEPIVQARQLLPVLRQERPDLILIGRAVLGDDGADTGAMLSALLDCSLATEALDLHLSAEEVVVTRATAGGSEELALRLPALVTAELALASPRYLTLMELMAARKKQAEYVVNPAATAAPLASLALHPVAPRRRGMLLASVAELAACLRTAIGTLP